MNEIITSNIQNKIYKINGVEVMLDSDLAELYQVETKRINEAVKNNPNKFPERFSWSLSIDETEAVLNNNMVKDSKSKISTLKKTRGSNIKYGARVFTEQGIYMLATILKSKVATEVSIAIMDTFVKMRHYINYNMEYLPHKFMLLEKKVDDNTQKINELFDKFNPKEIAKESMFFEGHFYDAYSLLMDILNSAEEEIIIIDNYVDKELLDILKQIDKKIIVVTRNVNRLLKEKYISQYDNISFVNNNSFHDRFVITDRETLYTCGASFKDLGKKCFYIGEIDNIEYLMMILETINI